MLFLGAQQLLIPDLNGIVDEVGQALPVKKLRRDLPSRNRTRDALDVIRQLPEPLRKRLGESARKPPYVVHCATAASDSRDYDHLCAEWRSGHACFAPLLTREQKRDAVELYGPTEVKQWRDWLAAEYRARHYAYGTRGLYLRRYFLQQCAHYRRTLDSDHQAPMHWQPITALMIRSRALVPSLYHRSGSIDYPSFTFSGGGARPEWR